jgi:hypothetical protein
MTLIGLIDRIRMLDNDLIRLNTKLNMILQEQERRQKEREYETPNTTPVDTNSSNN